MKKIVLLVVACCCIVLNSVSAQETKQKIGHLNGGNLLSMLPEVAVADSQLAKYRDTLITFGDSIATSFRTRAEVFMKKYQEGGYAPSEAEQIKANFEKEQAGIEAYGQRIDQAIAGRRQQLLAPILDHVSAKLKEVAKEGNFDYIFDEGAGMFLFTIESQDILPLMKVKLGLK